MNESDSEPSNSTPSPPPTPPCVTFFPPLYLQRRAKVHSLVLELCAQLCTLRSLLDVGCGTDALLLGSLTAPEEDFPLEVLTGIDIDDGLWTEGVKNAFGEDDANEMEEEDRWRNLTVNLLHGSFASLSKSFMGEYDVITACEVIEHLDPDILNLFSPVLLGRLRPKVFIVTTPNREFNRLFEMPFQSLEPDPESEEPYIYDPFMDPKAAGRRYYRDTQTYAMRHHDHRFEWTRAEFQTWTKDSATQHGYKVYCHTGCGRLGEGMQINGRGWDVNEALRREIISLSEEELDGLNFEDTMLRVFGHCTQIAVFVRLDICENSPSSSSSGSGVYEEDSGYQLPNRLSDTLAYPINGVRLVQSREFKATQTSAYPPSTTDLLDVVEAVSVSFLPPEIISQWSKDRWQAASAEGEKEYEVVLIETDMNKLWDRSTTIQRLCRNKTSVFWSAMMQDSVEIGDRKPYKTSKSKATKENDDIAIELRHVLYNNPDDSSHEELATATNGNTAHNEGDEHESDEETENKGEQPPPDKKVRIETKIIWPLRCSVAQLSSLDPMQLVTDDDLKESLTLRRVCVRTVATPNSSSSSASNSLVDIPLVMIFHKPETNCDMMYSDSLDMRRIHELGNVLHLDDAPGWDSSSDAAMVKSGEVSWDTAVGDCKEDSNDPWVSWD